MTGEELDKRMRQILLNVTSELSLSAVRELTALGFSRGASLRVVLDVLRAKEEGRYPHGTTQT